MTPSNLPGVRTTDGGLVDAVRDELVALHERWMGLVFPRQRATPDAVLGKWTPGTALGRLKYGLWGALGFPVVVAGYAVGLVGSPFRRAARRLGRLAETWGLAGMAWSAAFLGVTATALAWLSAGRGGAIVVGAAAATTVVLVATATLLARYRGRATTVLVTYPLGAVAIGLVPTVLAGVVDPTIATDAVAVTEAALATVAPSVPAPSAPALLAAAWAAVAVPGGWAAGLLVTLADLARPVST